MRENNLRQMLETPISKLLRTYPGIGAVFARYSLPLPLPRLTLGENLSVISPEWLRDAGLTEAELLDAIAAEASAEQPAEQEARLELRSLTILGGTDKSGARENAALTLSRGETVCVCGVTGSGKTRLLEDIEYVSSGDSPSGRVILIDGKRPSEAERLLLETRLCAYLSQTMNFIMELSCRDFIALHAACRRELADVDQLCRDVLECANSLAGEKLTADSIVTQLSGGQSRALMIADIACVSRAPVVLIDEPENAGIDRDEIIRLLSSKGKIVLISTHDPLIALSCEKRIVIENGGIAAVVERTQYEAELLEDLRRTDAEMKRMRTLIRGGKNILREKNHGL